MTGAATLKTERVRRTLSGAVLIAILVMAWPTSGSGAADSAAAGSAIPGPTVTGNYLAAHHARAEGRETDAASFLRAALAKSPDDPVLLGRTYVALAIDGRTAEAVEVARRFVAVEPGTAIAHIVVAVGDIHEGRFEAAATRLENIPQSPFSTFLVPILQAWTELGRGRKEGALASLERLKANAATTTLFNVHAAWLSETAGDDEAALRYARAAVEAEAEPWLRLTELAGELFERAGQKEEAAALYKSYLDRHPDSQLLAPASARLSATAKPARDLASARDGAAEALFDSAGIVGRQNNRETALMLGQLGLYLRPDFPAMQIVVGDMLDMAKRYDEANRIYAAIDPRNPLAATARIGMARNLDRLDRFNEAKALLEQMGAERPTDPEPMTELGDMLRRKERFAEAVAAYDKAAERIPEFSQRQWPFLYARGIALERSKLWPRAEADFLKALSFEPDQPLVLNYLGYSWVEQGHNLQEAETMIRKAVELRPNDGYIVDSLGWVLYRLNRTDEAVGHLERAVELRPEDPVLNDHLGDAYWAVGRQREARFQWTTALDSNPEPELKATLQQKLQNGLIREANAGAR